MENKAARKKLEQDMLKFQSKFNAIFEDVYNSAIKYYDNNGAMTEDEFESLMIDRVIDGTCLCMSAIQDRLLGKSTMARRNSKKYLSSLTRKIRKAFEYNV